MNLFQRILGMKRNNGNENAENMNAVTMLPEISEDLFTDQESPKAEKQEKTVRGTDLREFFKKDFASIGYSDGYHHHNGEMLEMGIRKIRADFRMEVDLLIDQKSAVLLEWQNQLLNLDGVSSRMTGQVENMIARLKSDIERIIAEKKLSAEDEGWVMKAIHPYKQGFLEGMNRYFEEKTLAESTGMFN